MKYSRPLAPGLLLTVMAALGPQEAMAAPETFNTALPVGTGDFVLRGQLLIIEASDDPTPENRDLDVRGGVSVLGYGVTSDVAVFAMLPYLDKELRLTLPDGQRIKRRSSGLGDAQFFVRYTAIQIDRPGANFRIAPFAGIKLPTGEDKDADRFGLVPQPLQPGSGSWDVFGGVVATYQTLDYQIDAQLSHKANSKANGFKFGDTTSLDTSLQYRLLPRELGSDVPGFLYGVIEANLVHQGKNEIDGIDDANSGGTKLFLSPGLQYVTRRWIIEAIVQLPLVQDLGGTALKDDYTLRAGFRVNF
ncbi:transporter [Sphingomonas sp.]|uniref:transporter n=1 Tax=Sphingomonas sp. TaxID=28214 RepID=UPI00307E935C